MEKTKQRKPLSEAQLFHLENIRKKAMKLITENANKQKEIDSGKLQKKLEKEHLAKKYEETMEKAKVEKIRKKN